MTETRNLLVEIGTEELPPKSLQQLATAFAGGIEAGLDQHNLAYGGCRWFASPRRLAVIIEDLSTAQPDQEVQRRGPAISAAYDDSGHPTKAAEGFARSCGVEVSSLETLENDKGSWLVFQGLEKGKLTSELLQGIIDGSVLKLPIPRRMRWGNHDSEFVRPVHWVVVLFGKETVPCTVLGITAGNMTFGHRVHHPQAIKLKSAEEYEKKLKTTGFVIPDFMERKEQIEEAVINAAKLSGGHHHIEEELLNEVTALVEWPVAITGEFEDKFLDLPRPVLIATMQEHQKYFPVKKSESGENENLMPCFVAIANLDSKDPQEIKKGNERVIRPRLSDAAFFWQRDSARPFSGYIDGLKDVVFQQELGTLHEKTERLKKLSVFIASELGLEHAPVERAALLSKCDLLTDMVGEFPKLQGVMGSYYARYSGEANEIATAIGEQYLPSFSGDRLPAGEIGQVLAIADKLDMLVGIFSIGLTPTGEKDPYGLRRAALGCLRIIIECELELDLETALMFAAGTFNRQVKADSVIEQVFDFMMERLRRYYLENQTYTTEMFDAVLATRPTRPRDFHMRIKAVKNFTLLPEAESLTAANKRIQNILRQATEGKIDTIKPAINNALLKEQAERDLALQLGHISTQIKPLISARKYTEALSVLSQLKDTVDDFFDNVMVMVDDQTLRDTRLQLLAWIRHEFNQVADISRLQG